LHAAIRIPDVARFEADPMHAGFIEGEVIFAPLGGSFPASGGRFNLFSPTDESRLKRMIYEVAFEADGEPYYLAGHKDVKDDPGFDAWSDTTTLYTRLHRGADANGAVVGAGVLRLGIDDLARLVSTLRATGADTPREKSAAIMAFGKFFLGSLWERYAAFAPRNV
jgi:cholesterol oxidase